MLTIVLPNSLLARNFLVFPFASHCFSLFSLVFSWFVDFVGPKPEGWKVQGYAQQKCSEGVLGSELQGSQEEMQQLRISSTVAEK